MDSFTGLIILGFKFGVIAVVAIFVIIGLWILIPYLIAGIIWVIGGFLEWVLDCFSSAPYQRVTVEPYDEWWDKQCRDRGVWDSKEEENGGAPKLIQSLE